MWWHHRRARVCVCVAIIGIAACGVTPSTVHWIICRGVWIETNLSLWAAEKNSALWPGDCLPLVVVLSFAFWGSDKSHIVLLHVFVLYFLLEQFGFVADVMTVSSVFSFCRFPCQCSKSVLKFRLCARAPYFYICDVYSETYACAIIWPDIMEAFRIRILHRNHKDF